MDVQAKLDEIVEYVQSARAMPMSASAIINRTELLAMFDELREMLPTELRQAQYVIRDRQEVVQEGRREAERILESARNERARLLAKTEVVQEAAREAERVLAEARQHAADMRIEVDDYVDAKLANFEVVLQKTMNAVVRGRDKLRGRHELDALRESAYDSEDSSIG